MLSRSGIERNWAAQRGAGACVYVYVSGVCVQYGLRASAVQTWISHDRIKGEVEWTPVFPGKNGDWKQHSLINTILAACDRGIRRLEDWVGNSSDKIDRGGRPSSASSAGVASKPRGRPPRPPQVATDSPVQAAVRSRLRSMVVENLRGVFTFIFPNQKGVACSTKESLVDKLMTTPDKLALLAAALDIDGATSQESMDTSDLAQLTALLARLPGPAARSAPAAAGSPAPHPGPDPPPPPPHMKCTPPPAEHTPAG